VAEEEERQQAAYKEQIRNASIDYSKMVDEMFGFVDNSQDMIDDRSCAPTAFQVSDFVSLYETKITLKKYALCLSQEA